MTIKSGRPACVRSTESADPRTRLAQEKFFTQRPKPLERWLWRRRVSAAAERVFWFHWSEGARNGDWCSQFSLHFVAQHCEVDTSTVTRAYQALKRLGLVRRTDPGRDAANPFEQATFITEVLLPAGVFADLAAAPNRAAARPRQPDNYKAAPAQSTAPKLQHPHEHLSLAERRARLKSLAAALSPAELNRWNKALCGSARHLTFDAETHVAPDLQAEIQQYLAARELPPAAAPPFPDTAPDPAVRPRRLTVFDTARLRAGLQQLAGLRNADELTRQVLWSIESGSLRQFTILHAINIALKKIREGQWTRPNRMPPNWMRKLNGSALPETCSGA
jgi:hypothetical protein